jgi:hypothetical protein
MYMPPIFAANDGARTDAQLFQQMVSKRALLHWAITGCTPLKTATLCARDFENVVHGENRARLGKVHKELPVFALAAFTPGNPANG